MKKLLLLLFSIAILAPVVFAAETYPDTIEFYNNFLDLSWEINDEVAGFEDLIDYSPNKKNVIYSSHRSYTDSRVMIYNIEHDQSFIIELNEDSRFDKEYYEFLYSPDEQYFIYKIYTGQRPGREICVVDLNNAYELMNRFFSDPDENLVFHYPLITEAPICLTNKINELSEDIIHEIDNISWEGDILTFSASNDELLGEQWQLNLDTEEVIKTGVYPPSPFSDLPETDEDYETILTAKNDGWLQGYPDGTIKLENPVNRAEFVKIAIKAFSPDFFYQQPEYGVTGIVEQSPPPELSHICPDAPASEWYASSLYTAKELGLVEGYPEEGKDESEWLCKPGNTINRVEALKIMIELTEAREDKVDILYYNQYADTDYKVWYSEYTAYSRLMNLFRVGDDIRLHPGDAMTRREMIYLTSKMKDMFISGDLNHIPESFTIADNPNYEFGAIGDERRAKEAQEAAQISQQEIQQEIDSVMATLPFGSTANKAVTTKEGTVACKYYQTAQSCVHINEGAEFTTINELVHGYRFPQAYTSLWQEVDYAGGGYFIPYDNLEF